MNDVQEDSKADTTATAASPSVPAAPPSPQVSGVFPIPTETAAVLRDIDMACAATLQKLGDNEVEYLSRKNTLLADLRGRREMFGKLVDDAGRKGGLDLDRQRWVIDVRTMTLTRAS